jgi:murein DD-endopeptidase MepM/ murein hydrolase activator NlpD
LVEVDHANGYLSRYGHHQKLLVTEGMVIKKGDSLGIMGDTGRSTGPHVHVEVLKNGKNVNPAKFLVKI